MDWTVTVAAALALAAIAALCGWAGSRPPNLKRGPRLMPYRFLMMLAATGCILMLVHLLNLNGVKTGR